MVGMGTVGVGIFMAGHFVVGSRRNRNRRIRSCTRSQQQRVLLGLPGPRVSRVVIFPPVVARLAEHLAPHVLEGIAGLAAVVWTGRANLVGRSRRGFVRPLLLQDARAELRRA